MYDKIYLIYQSYDFDRGNARETSCLIRLNTNYYCKVRKVMQI